jgi:hypothetical protein
MMEQDQEIKFKAWSKLWTWTSESRNLRDVINSFEPEKDSIQAYRAIKSHFEMTSVYEKATLLETQLNTALTMIANQRSADSKSVKRLQTHIIEMSNKLASLVPPHPVMDSRKLTLFRGGLPQHFKQMANTFKISSPDDTFLEHSSKIIQEIISEELHKAVKAQHQVTSQIMQGATSTSYDTTGRGSGGRQFGGRWNSGRGRGRGGRESMKFPGECRHCGIYGHKWINCRKRINGEPRTTGAASSSKGPDNFPTNLSDDEQDTHPSDKASNNVIVKKPRVASLKLRSLTSTVAKLALATILYFVQVFHLQASKQAKKRTSKLGWIIDSGASVHVCNKLYLLSNIKYTFTTWQLANGSYLNSSIMGELGNIGPCIYAPNVETNIMSVKLLNNIGYSVSLNSNGTVTVTRDGNTTTLGYQYIDDLLLTVDEFEGLQFV